MLGAAAYDVERAAKVGGSILQETMAFVLRVAEHYTDVTSILFFRLSLWCFSLS